MTISILYDNTEYRKDMPADWGFSALVRTPEANILFDAGSDGKILLENLEKTGVDPVSVDTVFVSHHHFDHTGGLAAFLRANPDVRVFVPRSLRGVRRAKAVVHVDKAQTLFGSVHSTGELRGIEQSMIVETSAGNVVVVGCAHPGLETILPAAQKFGPIHALVGGFHGFDKLYLLKNIEYVCPTHCTQQIEAIAERYPEKYLPGGTGRQYEFPLTRKPKEVR